MKKFLSSLFLGLCIAGCTTSPIVAPLTLDEALTMSCRQLMQESAYLNRLQAEVQHSNYAFSNDSAEHKADVVRAAKDRLRIIREASAQKMCTFG